MNNDFINGCFEFLGGLMLLFNISKLINDKTVKGVSWQVVVFWSLWGVWNLWFYPHVGCWWSFAGGVLVVTCNAVWLGLLWYYVRRNR